MAATQALQVARGGPHGLWARAPLWTLLLCWAMGVGAALEQMVPLYKAEARCSDKEYFNHGKCCARCPPGQYAAQKCTSDADTKCHQCPRRTVTEIWNFVDSCLICSACDAVKGFELDTPCSATKKTSCKCKSGTHCKKMQLTECAHCTQHTECPPGREVAKPGSMFSDTECEPCKEGYYQSERSMEARCQRHTDCLSQGLQVMTHGSDVSDSVCAEVLLTVTPPTDLGVISEEKSNYLTPFIVLGTGILISIALLFMVVLIRTPLVCKEIGKFFHHEDQRTELDRSTHTNPLLTAELVQPRNPMEVSMPQRGTRAAGPNLEVPRVVVESEHLQQNATSVGQVGGPYLQETEPTSPSVGPCPPSIKEVLPGESNPKENLKTTMEGTATSDGTPISTGANSGVQIQGAKITYTGNIYIYQVPVAPAGSVHPVQVTLDPNNIPTSIPEQGIPPPPMGQPPLPFCRGPASGWPCITPQQEEGTDMHLPTEERMMESMWPEALDSPLYVDGGSEIGFEQNTRVLPNGELY